jgi:DnaK suppressor protein
MSSHLTNGQRALLLAELQARRRTVKTQYDTLRDGRSRVDHASDVLRQDGDDAPQRAMDREVDFALSDHDLHELAAIDRALARLEAPSYGVCSDCGIDIPFDRLKVEPQAERCVACETKHEKGR